MQALRYIPLDKEILALFARKQLGGSESELIARASDEEQPKSTCTVVGSIHLKLSLFDPPPRFTLAIINSVKTREAGHGSQGGVNWQL